MKMTEKIQVVFWIIVAVIIVLGLAMGCGI
jgi:hypothetical protein